MKLKTLLILGGMIIGATAQAGTITEPTFPKLPSPKTSALATDGTTVQYLYNVDAQAFLRGANDYMTRATLDDTLGYKFTVTPQTGETYSLSDYVLKFSTYLKMFAVNQTGVWVDNDNGANADTWTITDNGDGTFSIGNTAFSEMVLGGVRGDTPASATSVADCSSIGIYVNLREQGTYGFCSRWAAVSESDYNSFVAKRSEIKTAVSKYETRVAIYEELVEAEATYPKADFASVESTYNNVNSTLAELTSAKEKIATIIDTYINSNKKNATLDNPLNITPQIAACNMSNVTDNGNKISKYWSLEFTGEGSIGSIRKNTWSSEGISDGTNMTTPFIENWNGSTYLSNLISHIDTVTVPAGAYKITANVRLYNEAYKTGEGNIESINGAYLFGNFQNKEIVNKDMGMSSAISTGEEGYFTYTYAYDGGTSDLVGYYAPEATTYAVVGNDGQLTFGLETKDANYNWQSYKDFKVYYLGSSDASVKYARDTQMRIDYIPDSVLMTSSLKAEYNGYLETYKTSASASEILTASDNINALLKSNAIEQNKSAWQSYINIVNTSSTILNGQIDKSNSNVIALSNYVNETYKDILEKKSLSTDELANEIVKVNLMNVKAQRAFLEGADVSDYLTNRDFSEGTKGWEGNVTVNYACGEKYGTGNFDVYQDLQNLPVGIYEISMQGFYRQYRDDDANKAAWYNYFENTEDAYTKKVPAPDTLAYVYLNDMKTPLNCVYDYKQPLTYDTESGKYTSDFYGATNFSLDPYNKYAYPNDMQTAALAFADGAYTVKAYAVVGKEGDAVRVGVKGDLTPGGKNNNWAIFDNFTLTYRAKNDSILTNVLVPLASNAIDLSKKMGSDVRSEAQTAINTLKSASSKNQKFNAIVNLYACATKVDESVALFKKLNDAYNVFDTLTIKMATGNPTYVKEAQDFDFELGDVLVNDVDYTNAQAEEALAKLDALTRKVNLPANISAATKENPVDVSAAILNRDFELGTLENWNNDGSASCSIQNDANFGKGGEYYASGWYLNGSVDMNQTISALVGLPAGTYRLSASAYSTTGDACIYANEVSTAVTNKNYALTVSRDTVTFTIVEGYPIKIGVSGSSKWNDGLSVDDFKLEYLGKASDVEDVNGDGHVNISDVNAVLDVICNGTENASADVNGDGHVNISDVNAIISKICGE